MKNNTLNVTNRKQHKIREQTSQQR